jgi:hypothetical protein
MMRNPIKNFRNSAPPFFPGSIADGPRVGITAEHRRPAVLRQQIDEALRERLSACSSNVGEGIVI